MNIRKLLDWRKLLSNETPKETKRALGILATGLLATVGTISVQVWVQRNTDSSHVALLLTLEPVFAGLTSYVFAGERLAWVPGVAVDADLVSVSGEPAMHVAISPMPDRWTKKVARLGMPNSPLGEPS